MTLFNVHVYNSQPEFISMIENFYLFNMLYDVFADDDYLQLTLKRTVSN